MNKNLLVEEHDENMGDLIYDVLDDSEEVLQGDNNATLAIQKNFLASKDNLNEDWLCNSLSHLTYDIKDKVCNIIIYSDGCENNCWRKETS